MKKVIRMDNDAYDKALRTIRRVCRFLNKKHPLRKLLKKLDD